MEQSRTRLGKISCIYNPKITFLTRFHYRMILTNDKFMQRIKINENTIIVMGKTKNA